MQYVIDERQTVHALKARSGVGDTIQFKTLCCGQAGQWRILVEFPQDGPLCEFCALYMLPEVTVEGFYLPTLARVCRVLRSPINGDLAALVWRLSNCIALSTPLAQDFMRACGYVPFQGFPLTRLKTPNLGAAPKQ